MKDCSFPIVPPSQPLQLVVFVLLAGISQISRWPTASLVKRMLFRSEKYEVLQGAKSLAAVIFDYIDRLTALGVCSCWLSIRKAVLESENIVVDMRDESLVKKYFSNGRYIQCTSFLPCFVISLASTPEGRRIAEYPFWPQTAIHLLSLIS